MHVIGKEKRNGLLYAASLCGTVTEIRLFGPQSVGVSAICKFLGAILRIIHLAVCSDGGIVK